MLSNMFKPPVTTDYPIKPKQFDPNDRGRVLNDIEKCIFCGNCQRNCPADAIIVNRAKGTWEINPFSCVQCKNCVDACPKKCLSMDPHYTEPATEKKSILMQGTPPAPPKKPVIPPKPAVKPAEAVAPAQATKPAEAVKPVAPTEAAKPAEAVKNAEAAKPAVPAEAAEVKE